VGATAETVGEAISVVANSKEKAARPNRVALDRIEAAGACNVGAPDHMEKA
jgi:hypothetical protein